MELHATVALWDGPQLTLYESTQSVNNSQDVIAQARDQGVGVILITHNMGVVNRHDAFCATKTPFSRRARSGEESSGTRSARWRRMIDEAT